MNNVYIKLGLGLLILCGCDADSATVAKIKVEVTASASEPASPTETVIPEWDDSTTDIDHVVWVDEKPISRTELETRLNRMKTVHAIRTRQWTPEIVKRKRQILLESMIDETLLRTHAEKTALTVTPADVDKIIQGHRIKFDSDEGFQKHLASQNITMETLREMAENDVIWNKIEAAGKPITAPEKAIKARFQEQFRRPAHIPQIQLRSVTIRGDDLLEKTKELVKEKTPISAWRKILKQTPKTTKLGWVDRNAIDAEVAKRLFRISTESFVQPTPGGVQVFFVDGRRELPTPEFQKVRPTLEKHFIAQRRRIARQEFLNNLRQRSKIRFPGGPAVVDSPTTIK